MNSATRFLAEFCYGFFGAIFLVAGVSVFLANTGLLPAAQNEALVDFARGDLGMLHILQELGSIFVFVGLISFWFVGHYEQSRAFHWSMTAFWGLFALAHWFDVRGPSPTISGPLWTTVPLIVFVAIGLLRAWRDGKTERVS